MSIEELIALCKKDNRKAQAQLYRKYAPILFGTCLKYSRNKTEAEDNLHDSFITIFDKIAQYSGKGSFEGWMKRITLNTVLQKYRKQKHLQVISKNIEEEKEAVEIDDTNINIHTLLKYVQDLPNKYRLTFNMYVLDGCSHQEISEQLGTSIGTSKSNLARARKLLKEKIERHQNKIIIGFLLFFISEKGSPKNTISK